MKLTLTIMILSSVCYAQAKPAQPVELKPVQQAAEDVDRALKQQAGVEGSLEALARSGAATGSKKDKKRVRRTLKGCLKHKVVEVQLAAVRAYGQVQIKGSSHDLRSLVDHRNPQNLSYEVMAVAIVAWGQIHDAGTHKDLLDHIRVPSHLKQKRELACVAARALAGYKPLKGRKRYEMLKDYMHSFTLIYGAAITSPYRSVAAGEWWAALHVEMVETFNVLTGSKTTTYTECVKWWKRNKQRVKAGK